MFNSTVVEMAWFRTGKSLNHTKSFFVFRKRSGIVPHLPSAIERREILSQFKNQKMQWFKVELQYGTDTVHTWNWYCLPSHYTWVTLSSMSWKCRMKQLLFYIINRTMQCSDKYAIKKRNKDWITNKKEKCSAKYYVKSGTGTYSDR
jgi:hypothetical protein